MIARIKRYFEKEHNYLSECFIKQKWEVVPLTDIAPCYCLAKFYHTRIDNFTVRRNVDLVVFLDAATVTKKGIEPLDPHYILLINNIVHTKNKLTTEECIELIERDIRQRKQVSLNTVVTYPDLPVAEQLMQDMYRSRRKQQNVKQALQQMKMI